MSDVELYKTNLNVFNIISEGYNENGSKSCPH